MNTIQYEERMNEQRKRENEEEGSVSPTGGNEFFFNA
jgi:hypothetical protein